MLLTKGINSIRKPIPKYSDRRVGSKIRKVPCGAFFIFNL
jgi:hypothetical protein